MNKRLVVVFGFALIVAGATSCLLCRVIVSHIQSAPVHSAVVSSNNTLVVAAHDLQVGALIHEADVRQASWAGPLPAQVIAKIQDAIVRGVIANMYQNEPILNTRLAAKGAGAHLASTIPMGRRAVALRGDEVVGLPGFVSPGLIVDVLVAVNLPGSQQ